MMKIVSYLLMGAAFLLVVSSALSLISDTPHDMTPVYVNLGAMFCICVAVGIISYNKNNKR